VENLTSGAKGQKKSPAFRGAFFLFRPAYFFFFVAGFFFAGAFFVGISFTSDPFSSPLLLTSSG
jgi:hypothetical protein